MVSILVLLLPTPMYQEFITCTGAVPSISIAIFLVALNSAGYIHIPTAV